MDRGWTKPVQEYGVLFTVEHLQLPGGAITIAGVEFFCLDEQRAHDWDIDQHPTAQVLAEEPTSQTAGVVTVRAGSSKRAVEYARERFDTALNVLRVCAAGFPVWRIFDEQLLFRRGRYFAVRLRMPAARGGSGMDPQFTPRRLDLEGDVLQETTALAQRLQPLFDGTLQEEPAVRLLRALEKIAMSITREHLDDRIGDLCTALESFLVPSHERSKGTLMALRMALLAETMGRPFVVPTELQRLYDLRNSIVHGSRQRVATHKDYSTLRYIALTTLRNALEFAAQPPGVATIAALIRAIETKPLLAQTLSWRQHRSPSGAEEREYLERLTTCARDRLKRASRRPAGPGRSSRSRGGERRRARRRPR